MTEPLLRLHELPARPVLTIRPACLCITVILLAGTLIGCSDSHSDDYVTFENLEQAPPSEPSPATDRPEAEDPSEPVADLADTPIETASHTTESDNADDDVEQQTPSADSSADDSEPQVETASATASSTQRPIKLLIPSRRFRKEGNALRATFDDIDLLKVLNMEPVPVDAADHFPDWLKQLNGAHVRIRGYMRPGYIDEDITEFLFVRDNGECCYGPLPKIYDMIAVQLAEGESTDLIDGTPFDVEGTFRIEPYADEVELYGLFFIDDGVISE